MEKPPPITKHEARDALKRAQQTLRYLNGQRIDIRLRDTPYEVLRRSKRTEAVLSSAGMAGGSFAFAASFFGASAWLGIVGFLLALLNGAVLLSGIRGK